MESFTKETREILGSQVEISIGSHEVQKAREAIESCFQELERIDRSFSRFREDSELSMLNSKVGEWVDVSEELYELIQWGLKFHEKTQGAFDLCIQQILESWGYDADYSFQQKERTIGQAVGQIECGNGPCVRIGAPIDLGGLGKGYALDRLVQRLAAFDNICVNAGGDLYVRGLNEKGLSWKVAFEHPQDLTKAIGMVEADDLFLASSSSNRRRWGKYHHLVDPLSAQPSQGMLSVYTQADSGIEADAYATALFVMGYEKAKSLVNKLPIEFMLISSQGAIFRTPSFKGELFKA